MTKLNKSKLRVMRNEPAKDMADFSTKLDIKYRLDENLWQVVDTPQFKTWKENAVSKLAKQGKPFKLVGIVNGVTITVIGKRI